ncbi:dicarboxylate:amino acid:cation symporter DAACS family protein [Lachnospiraceae bacterium]|uniref:dicarboxylate/amino acid:cation symporter n=1 Tax=Extibacter sp. GGCC_0201 TaxID=2731209 RepID=UPI001AA0FFA8|nr:dicarboxylate/amino acid:cation symporter [Extibacter sp. GGCC_0201]MBO1720953.1 dicarboxylate/amino acid:cation symporter [Extibacter sp. GGCC_0201]BDF31987.1 dicarboxylate:amino acid:cation symporter DAACS family protein [Lachnospiraceae bacterium]BDF36000.1 dicarboxylate:amino acid:cation symporter DAACS family protein [Lachnospiraceae bacterium]
MDTKKEKKKVSLTVWILAALVLGVIAGLLLQTNSDIAETYIKPLGTIFLNLVKMVVVPVVLFSIMQGVISLQDIRKVGSIGGKTVLFYMCTTAFAVTLGLVIANVLSVGSGYKLSSESLEAFEGVTETPSFIDTIVNIFPSNAIQPLAEATMLQIIVIALFFGFGIILAGEKGKLAGAVVESFSEVCIKVMGVIIKLSPIGVFGLITPVIATNGMSILLPLMKLIGVVYLVCAVHMVCVYSSLVRAMAKMSPLTFFKGMGEAMIFAFSSASSVGTLPFNMECTQKLGARKEVSSFVLPLGATINMDGTAIYQGVSVIFIAQIFGMNLTISQQITIILTATLASIGTAGVPGSGVIMLAMVLQSVGLPLEGIALVAGVDRILDMARTTVNITGDAACTICVDASEKKRELKRPHSMEADG